MSWCLNWNLTPKLCYEDAKYQIGCILTSYLNAEIIVRNLCWMPKKKLLTTDNVLSVYYIDTSCIYLVCWNGVVKLSSMKSEMLLNWWKVGIKWSYCVLWMVLNWSPVPSQHKEWEWPNLTMALIGHFQWRFQSLIQSYWSLSLTSRIYIYLMYTKKTHIISSANHCVHT